MATFHVRARMSKIFKVEASTIDEAINQVKATDLQAFIKVNNALEPLSEEAQPLPNLLRPIGVPDGSNQ